MPAVRSLLGRLADVRLTAPPSDGEALVYDETEGKWVNAPVAGGGGAGGAPGWVLLSSTTLSGAGTFDVSSIPAGYQDLYAVLIARSTVAAIGDTPRWRFNNVSTSDYFQQHYQSHGALALTSDDVRNGTAVNAGGATGATSPANWFAVNQMTVFGYASTTWAKCFQLDAFTPADSTTGNLYIDNVRGLLATTAPIDRVAVSGAGGGNLDTGSQLRIYGRA